MKQSIASNIAAGAFLTTIVAVLIYGYRNEAFRNKIKWADERDKETAAVSKRSIVAWLIFVIGFVPPYILDGILGYYLSWYPFLWFVPAFLFLLISMVRDHYE